MNAPAALAGLRGRVDVLDSSEDIAAHSAALVRRACEAAERSRRSFSIALAGGTTPTRLYEVLASPAHRSRIAWDAWEVYFGDERAVPPDDRASNYRLARTTLLDHVPVDPGAVHRMEAERADLDAAADEYSALLAATLPQASSGVPRMDTILLGLGENGHTASLFPGTPALDVVDRWATRGRADYAPFDRITLTFPILNAASLIVVLVTGVAKHAALLATIAGTAPAAQLAPRDGELHWLLDRAAASGVAS